MNVLGGGRGEPGGEAAYLETAGAENRRARVGACFVRRDRGEFVDVLRRVKSFQVGARRGLGRVPVERAAERPVAQHRDHVLDALAILRMALGDRQERRRRRLEKTVAGGVREHALVVEDRQSRRRGAVVTFAHIESDRLPGG